MATIDPTQLKHQQDIRTEGIAFCMELLPESSRASYGSSDFGVYETDWSAEKPESQRWEGETHESYVTGMARSDRQVITCSYDGQLIWWDSEQKKSIRRVAAHDKWCRRVVATPDQTRVCSVADDMVCKVWEAASGKLIHELRGHDAETPHHYPSMLYACTVSADNRWLATADRVGKIVVWDLEKGTQQTTLEAPVMYTWDPRQRRHSIGGIRSLQFSADGKLLAAGGIGKIGNIDHLGGPSRIEIFDWQAGERTQEIENDKFKGLVESMIFAADSSWLCAGGGDHNGFICFYNPANGEILHQDKAPMHVHEMQFSADGQTLFAAGHEKLARFEFPQPEAPAEEQKSEPAEEPTES